MSASRILNVAIVIGALLPALLLFGFFYALYSVGSPSPEARENYRLLEAKLSSGEALTLASFRPGNWQYACVGGEYATLPDFRGDIVKVTPWAIVLYDGKGSHFTWHMNERLLRYRTEEDQAYGWCFNASAPLRLVAGNTPLLDIPGRSVRMPGMVLISGQSILEANSDVLPLGRETR